MMSDVIRQETVVFLLAVLHGVSLTLLYDLIRVLRRVFTHSLAVISLEDLLFWLTAGFLTFLFAFRNTDGVIRGYTAVGIGLGAVFYHEAVSKAAVRLLSGCLLSVKKLILIIWRKVWTLVSRILIKGGKLAARAGKALFWRPLRKITVTVHIAPDHSAEQVRKNMIQIAAKIREVLSKPVKKFCKIKKKRIEFTRKRGYNSGKMRGDRPGDDS